MEPIRETERELVGAFLRDNDNAALRETLVDTLDVLTPADFSGEIAGELFGIVRTLTKERNELPTIPAIIDGARSNPVLKTLDYHAIIAEWGGAGAYTSATVEADRERIKKESERRAVAYELSRGLDELKDPAKNPAAVFQSVVHAVEQEQDKGRETVIKSCSQIWYDFLEEVESGEPLIRIPTGLEPLDKALGGGYRSGTLNIIAARPGDGKSALLLQQARAAARAGFSPLIFSLEMTGCELIERFYRQTIGGNPQLFSSESAAELNSYLEAEFFEVIDAPMDIDEIEAYSLRYHRKHPDSVYYVDYLGMIRKTKEQGNLTAVDFLDEISRRLKTVAKRTGAPVILLAQLNRDSTNTD
ncbi:MAG: AAA family ATPase, partial [Thermoguttaceae bacterium]|nr:AAA family ATPase [Thermoguttaceae bacterium]